LHATGVGGGLYQGATNLFGNNTNNSDLNDQGRVLIDTQVSSATLVEFQNESGNVHYYDNNGQDRWFTNTQRTYYPGDTLFSTDIRTFDNGIKQTKDTILNDDY
jgi:hypothetical protein